MDWGTVTTAELMTALKEVCRWAFGAAARDTPVVRAEGGNASACAFMTPGDADVLEQITASDGHAND